MGSACFVFVEDCVVLGEGSGFFFVGDVAEERGTKEGGLVFHRYLIFGMDYQEC